MDDSGTGIVVRRKGGPLRRLLSRLTSSYQELEAEELLQESQESGATPVVACPDRERVRVAGTLRTVTLRPRAGVPALEAELFDGSGTVMLVWLGRRQIAGIEPGRQLIVEGRIANIAGMRMIFNPKYELRPFGA
ncbi:DNA-binding protein [Carbonactinospora thermoautotrophica]|nr:OB-fold nucleic acid binding domain-containing protein [Carbonactinospora thermoautotrophica]MCX9190728.1 DNA-binding protein [Carbonactinospora thermoautotrophica]